MAGRQRMVAIVGLAVALSAGGAFAEERRPEQASEPLAGCPAAAKAYCERLCAPEQLVFLPCMAVGARSMAACREREVAACRDACTARRDCRAS